MTGLGLGLDNKYFQEFHPFLWTWLAKKFQTEGCLMITLWGITQTEINCVERHNLINHVESVHFPNTFTYTCKFCGKQYIDFILVDPSTLNDYIQKDSSTGAFSCLICGKVNAQKNNIRKHIEGVHFPGQFVVSCNVCFKQFNGKNSLSVHMYKFHNNAQ